MIRGRAYVTPEDVKELAPMVLRHRMVLLKNAARLNGLTGLVITKLDVLDGIEAAERAGLRPIKINMVVRRGLNESSVLPMARFAREHGYIMRFIEYMDVGHTNGWSLAEVVPAAEIVAAIDAELPLEPLGDALVPEGGGGRHVQLAPDRLVAMPVVRELLDVLPGDL